LLLFSEIGFIFSLTHQPVNAVLVLSSGFTDFSYTFICQGTLNRRQRSDRYGLRVKLPPVTTSLTTQR